MKLTDWYFLMDTTGAITFVSAVLLVITLILNGITLIIYINKIKEKNKFLFYKLNLGLVNN